MPSEPSKARDYDVGYGKPPKHSQFKPGQSGNPRGRPKRTRDAETLIERELDRKVRIKENGQVQTRTLREVFIKSLIQDGIKGKAQPQKTLLALLLSRKDPDSFVVDSADQQALDDFLQRVSQMKE